MHPQPKHSVKHCYEFGPFRLDAGERLLYRNGDVVPLTSKVFDILLVFVANSGRTLEKEEVMEQVWPGQYVEEGNLTRNVSTLRKALSESPDEHRYIVTIPGRGYRFVAEVKEVTDEDVVETADSAPPPTSPFTPRRRSSALALAALLVLLAAVGGLVGWYFRPKPTPSVGRAVPLTSDPGFERNPALSPDGNQVAFSGTSEEQDKFDSYTT